MIVLQLLLCILLTDLLTGAVHWWEDAYGNPDWKILGERVVKPNIEHHKNPRAFLKHGAFERIRLSLAIAIGLGFVCWLLGIMVWQVAFCLLYGAMANEIHAAAHRTKRENGKFVTFLQRIGLMQSRRMHGYHHSAPFDVNYCVLTNYLNPILNRIRFWSVLEQIVALFGIEPTRGNANRNGY